MFKSTQTKVMSACVQLHAADLGKQLQNILSDALSGAGREEDYLDNLAKAFSNRHLLKMPTHSGLAIETFVKKIHQRPKVYFNGVAGPELGDLLVSVRYLPKDAPAEEKSIIYQVKVEQSQNTAQWKIAANQLDLLSLWPSFNLASSPTVHSVKPLTKEAAAYLLLRKPIPAKPAPLSGGASWAQQMLAGVPNDASFGTVIPASGLASVLDGVKDSGVKAFQYETDMRSSESIAHAGMGHLQRSDVDAFFQHIAFDRGEPHEFNADFAALVTDVFSFVGRETKNSDLDHGYFMTLEIVVRPIQ